MASSAGWCGKGGKAATFIIAVCAMVAPIPAEAIKSGTTHTLTIDDVLGMAHLDQVAASPDGALLAAVVQRPALAGEVYGRTAYEVDPSRDDIWLISRRTRERRNVTQGATLAAGFWCASWSPDGRKLAMLSTRPEGGEPRGGDNVRLYVWDRDTDRLARLGDAAMMTQTRYGGTIHSLDLRGGKSGGTLPHICNNAADEHAPFLWLDDHRLLALTLPNGQVSGLLDEASRPFRIEARNARRLHDGLLPTGEAVGSGAERTTQSPAEGEAIIQLVDTSSGRWNRAAAVPTYPFGGDLSLVVSPDGTKLAMLATTARLPPTAGRRFPHAEAIDWIAGKRLGIVDLRPGTTIRWLSLPVDASTPLELYGWSPDSQRVALRSRANGFDARPVPLIVEADSGRVVRVAAGIMDQESAGTLFPHDAAFIWLDAHHAVAQMRGKGSDHLDWWRIGTDGSAHDLTATWKAVPSTLRRFADRRLVGVAGSDVVALDPASGRETRVADFGAEGATVLWPSDPAQQASKLALATTDSDERQIIHGFTLSGSVTPGITLPATAGILGFSRNTLLWQDEGKAGLFLRETDLATDRTDTLLPLDTSLASIDWGKTMFIDYRTIDGMPIKGAVILPPGYKPGRRYPTLVWVYEGHRVDEHGEYWLDPQMPGVYNLQLYAAQGYAVLIPSMPLPPNAQRRDVYAAVTRGVMPAIDRLVALGIADPDRLGVFGQSYGGYSVYALVSQSDRFRAGVAMAGITDLVSLYGEFDPLARGYPGVAHEKSSNGIIADQFGLHAPPDEDMADYVRNSPLTYVDQVHTPLLMLHGDDDVRGSVTQAEQFFYGLYGQGKTARLVRYGGESHSLAQSPANVRDILRETLRWFDYYVREAGARLGSHF